MTIPTRITCQNFPSTPTIEASIRDKANALERFHDRIVECRVVLEQVGRQHHKGRMYDVRIDVTVPGGEIIVDRGPGEDHAHEDLNVALRDAFSAARRKLEDHVRQMDGHRAAADRFPSHQAAEPSKGVGKTHHLIQHGTVVRLFAEGNYGFIATQDNREVYFHRNSVAKGEWNRLGVGSRVRFTEEAGEKGPHAHNVTLIA